MRVGVFATRSPFRPNPLGLSVVKLKRVEYLENGAPVLVVTGADMMDGTPVFDIKPYVPFADSHPEAKGGFTDQVYGMEFAGYEVKFTVSEKVLHVKSVEKCTV